MIRELLKYANRRKPVKIGTSGISEDAWGRAKTITDYSLFHGVFTLGIPPNMWLEHIDGVEVATTNMSSVDGKLVVQGIDSQTNFLMSKRHPKYQPNKGHLFSTSALFPNNDVACNQEIGLLHADAGVFFRVNAGVLYAVRRTKLGAVVTDVAEAIQMPSNFKLQKGNIYDIQMQWRGVGNIFFYVNQKLVHTMNLLGGLEELSVWNPALPIGFSVDGAAAIYIGCVDVTSEGGNKEARQRSMVDSDEIPLAAEEVPVLLVHVPTMVNYNGNMTMNTRDNSLKRIAGFADDSTIIKMYFTRDSSKFTGTVFTPNDDNTTVEYAVDGDIVIDNLTTNIKRALTRRIAANTSIEITNPDDEVGELYVTHGDYVLVTMQAKNATVGGASIEWGAEL